MTFFINQLWFFQITNWIVLISSLFIWRHAFPPTNSFSSWLVKISNGVLWLVLKLSLSPAHLYFWTSYMSVAVTYSTINACSLITRMANYWSHPRPHQSPCQHLLLCQETKLLFLESLKLILWRNNVPRSAYLQMSTENKNTPLHHQPASQLQSISQKLLKTSQNLKYSFEIFCFSQVTLPNSKTSLQILSLSNLQCFTSIMYDLNLIEHLVHLIRSAAKNDGQ